jgi:hypothetical protein
VCLLWLLRLRLGLLQDSLWLYRLQYNLGLLAWLLRLLCMLLAAAVLVFSPLGLLLKLHSRGMACRLLLQHVGQLLLLLPLPFQGAPHLVLLLLLLLLEVLLLGHHCLWFDAACLLWRAATQQATRLLLWLLLMPAAVLLRMPIGQ